MIYFFRGSYCVGADTSSAIPDDELVARWHAEFPFDNMVISDLSAPMQDVYMSDGWVTNKPDRPTQDAVWDDEALCWRDAPPKPYGVLRAMAYPKLADQLDALWHAMDNGTMTKIPGFYDPIQEIKLKFPKGA